MGYQPIADYGVVGDLHTVALVGMNGSIDFMCFPRFDSPSIFAALLDDERGGRFQISPQLSDAEHRQLYLPDSNVLLTRFLSDEGVGEVSDFMPIEEADHAHNLVRRAKTVRGELTFRMVCNPRFDYGRVSHRVEQRKNEVVFVSEGANRLALRLHSSVPMRIENGAAVAEFTLGCNKSASFVLEDADQSSQSESPDYVSDSFKQTLDFWRNWVGKCKYSGRWHEEMIRSALTLKMLVYAPTGAIVAAPTFGLPEQLGGPRNWDYRYVWIRDASFTLYALMRLGYVDEGAAFIHWIEQRCCELNPDGSLQIMYGVDGRHKLDEEILEHFEGYRNSSPVRVGNDAYGQLQLDIHGELMDSVYLYNKYGEPISNDFWSNLMRLIDWVCNNWERPDEGIWEVRGGQHEFLYSRLMCWVAVDRGIRLAMKRSFPAPLDRWTKVRDAIYNDIFANFWDETQKTFVQHKHSTTVDAAALLMPLVKFMGPTDPRWLSTLRRITDVLVEDSMVHRYKIGEAAPDGLPGKEGTFSMCTFWYAECLARAGDVLQARFVFEKMLGYANHLGLFAEQIGARGEQLGNFPQAFTHLGLISAAFSINRRLSDRD